MKPGNDLGVVGLRLSAPLRASHRHTLPRCRMPRRLAPAGCILSIYLSAIRSHMLPSGALFSRRGKRSHQHSQRAFSSPT
jgi:hypothetical protein